MGFWGHLVFGRSEQPLLEAPVFARMPEDVKDSVSTWWPRPGGWQTLQLDHGLWKETGLPALVEWTGAGACVATVCDSDVALVSGMSTDGAQWRACLNVEAASRMWVEEPEDLDDVTSWLDTPAFEEAVRRQRAELISEVPASARGALAWAVSAGFGTDVEVASVEDLLLSEEVFAEDLFGALLDRLGFPEATQPLGES